MVGTVLWKWNPGEFCELIDCHLSGDQQRTVGTAHNIFFRRTFFGAEFADNCFQNIGRGHHAFKVTIFIDDEADVDRRCLKN